MGRSFVLKDASGRPGGYLMQTQDSIFCRAQCSQEAWATLLFDDGTQQAYVLDGGAEQRWPGEARTLCGGYIEHGDRLLLSSGAEAERAFERAVLRKSTARQRKAQEEKPAQACEKEAEQASAEESISAAPPCSWPQRRWPPPPCWPQARYAHGAWQEN